MFVLDTNVVSELRKVRSGKANPGVGAWATSTPAAQLFVSAITIHELEYGVLLAERSDPQQAALLRAWLDRGVTTAFAERILPVDQAVARRAGALHLPDPAPFRLPDPAPFRDALIAGTALVHHMAVVTRNVGDFERFGGLEVVDPWS
jgi:predicted nucleic acid-binding protein